MRSSLGIALALTVALAGCSDGDDDDSACPGVSTPVELELADVTPPPGASVPNDEIVHAFTVTTPVLFDSIAFTFPVAHSAGDPTPDLMLTFEETSAGTVYTAEPVTWEHAPAHVEIASPVVYETGEGCGYVLPTPLFSYDVTEP